MRDPIIDERRRKVEIIVGFYVNRMMIQEDIAKMLNIPVGVVRKVLQKWNFEYTKFKTKENLKEGQKFNMGLDYLSMDYLYKYNF